MVEYAVVEILKARRESGKLKQHSVSSYQDIHADVINYLITYKGFAMLETAAEWGCFGWASIFYKDWEDYIGDNNLDLIAATNAAGFTKDDDAMIQHKKKFKAAKLDGGESA